MEPEVTWTVIEPTGEVKKINKRVQLPYRDKVEIAEKMPKGQVAFAEGWNEMRARLLELGEMKSQ